MLRQPAPYVSSALPATPGGFSSACKHSVQMAGTEVLVPTGQEGWSQGPDSLMGAPMGEPMEDLGVQLWRSINISLNKAVSTQVCIGRSIPGQPRAGSAQCGLLFPKGPQWAPAPGWSRAVNTWCSSHHTRAGQTCTRQAGGQSPHLVFIGNHLCTVENQESDSLSKLSFIRRSPGSEMGVT